MVNLKTNTEDIHLQSAAFNVTHFELTILLVWVVGGVANNGGWVPCGLGFSEQWNVGPCSSAYFVWNSSC
jgi:hypothetical protein